MGRIALLCAVAHTLLLACYTLPAPWVPVRLRFWSQAYARVLFHQDWRLFAPDPPACGCTIEVRPSPEAQWQALGAAHPHFVWSRMCANACRFAEAAYHPGDTAIIAPPALTRSLEAMAGDLPRKGPLRFRVRRACATEEVVPLYLHPHR